LAVDVDTATEEEEETVDIEDVVVASDGGFIEDDADTDLETARGWCNGIGCVEGGRLSRCSWWKDRSTSFSCSSASLAQSCSLACWLFMASCEAHLSNGDAVLEVETRSK
jgi:hypothetical protein